MGPFVVVEALQWGDPTITASPLSVATGVAGAAVAASDNRDIVVACNLCDASSTFARIECTIRGPAIAERPTESDCLAFGASHRPQRSFS